MRHPVDSGGGFSLIELIFVVVTVSIISVVVAPVFMSGFNAFFWTSDVTNVSSQGELAMERMVREVRCIQPSDIVTPLGSSQITFSLSGTSVTYSRNLQNQITRNSDLLASNVSSLAFAYYRQDWSTATQPAEVWSIQIAMVVSGKRAAESLRTTVFLRNGLKVR